MPALLHPYYVPTRGLTMADEPSSVSLDTTLRHGLSAWVTLPARLKVETAGGFGDDETSGRPVGVARFRVPIRRLKPLANPPELGPRDPQVIEWLEAHDWMRGVEAIERRWAERNANGSLLQLAAARNTAEAIEWERRRLEDAQRPGFGDELLNQSGVFVGGLVEGAKEAANDVVEGASSLWTFMKWGAAVSAGVLVIKAARAAA